jgi:hypothetical protein
VPGWRLTSARGWGGGLDVGDDVGSHVGCNLEFDLGGCMWVVPFWAPELGYVVVAAMAVMGSLMWAFLSRAWGQLVIVYVCGASVACLGRVELRL